MAKQSALQRLSDKALEQRAAAAYQHLKECIGKYSSHHQRTQSAQKAYNAITREQLARRKKAPQQLLMKL